MSIKWKKSLSHLNDEISKVLKIINSGGMGITFVLDKNKKLKGTVTDGDIRRAMIRGIGLNTKVKNIMNKNWKGVLESDNQTKIISIMNKYDLLQIPILDASNRIKDVFMLSDLTKKKETANTIFIMAGGYGKRLMPLTKSTPKPMLQISGKPILETIIDQFTTAGFSDFIISTHYKARVIEDYFKDGSSFGIKIRYVREKEPLGTAGSLGKVKNEKINYPLIVINGDVVTKVNFIELLNSHKKSKSLFTTGVFKHTFQIPYGVIKLKDGNIIALEEKPNQSNFINAGIYVLEKEILKYIQNEKKMNMTDVIKSVIKSKKKINSFLVYENWIDIGLPDEYVSIKNNFN